MSTDRSALLEALEGFGGFGGFERADRAFARWIDRYSLPFLRYGLAVVFVWSGTWTLLGMNEAGGLLAGIFGTIPPEALVLVFGWWKIAIGCCPCYRPTVRIEAALTVPHIAVAVVPLALTPAATFTRFPLASPFEGVVYHQGLGAAQRRPHRRDALR